MSDIRFDTRTKGLTQLMGHSQAEVMARLEARLQSVRDMVKYAERKAEKKRDESPRWKQWSDARLRQGEWRSLR